MSKIPIINKDTEMDKIKEAIEDRYNKLMFDVKKVAKEKDCPKCGKNNWRIVPLHEFGDPYMPSSVNIFCKNCNYNETVAQLPDEEARAYANAKMKVGEKQKIDGQEYEVADAKKADELIGGKSRG